MPAYLQALADEHMRGLRVGRGASDRHHSVVGGAVLPVVLLPSVAI